jgi:hypothetical protein
MSTALMIAYALALPEAGFVASTAVAAAFLSWRLGAQPLAQSSRGSRSRSASMSFSISFSACRWPKAPGGSRPMDVLSSLGDGFVVAFTLQNLLLALLGCFLGTVMGALPGLGPSNGVAILIPLAFTLGLPATPALILLTASITAPCMAGAFRPSCSTSPATSRR